MATRDLPDIYSQARGPQARGRGHIYQANPEWPLWHAHLIGEERQTCIHHITFIQKFAKIDCGFKLWAQKEMIVGFTGCSDIILNQITTLWMNKVT